MPTDELKQLHTKISHDIIELYKLQDVNFQTWSKLSIRTLADTVPGSPADTCATISKNLRTKITKAYTKKHKMSAELRRRDFEELRAIEHERLNPRV
jgi:flavin-dependent dehydrogenase